MATTVTKTIRASGGDYSLLSSWEAAIPADLVTADEQWVAECYNDWASGLTDSINIASRTTDATRNIVIQGSSSSGTQGRSKPLGDFSEGFKITKSANWTDAILVNTNYVTIKDIRVSQGASGQAIDAGSKIVELSGIIAEAVTGNVSNACFYSLQTSATVKNCIASGGYSGFNIVNWNNTQINNCVAVNNVWGFFKEASKGTGHTLTNCIGYNNTIDFNLDAGTSDNTNASSDTTAPGTGSITSITSTEFADAANDDFHLSPTSNLIGAGTNLFTTFETDVDGDVWPSSGAWDIGFDYYVSAGTSTEIPKHNLSLTSYAPTITAGAGVSTEIPKHDLSLTSYSPTITVSDHQSIEVAKHDINLTSYAPTVTATAHQSIEIAKHDLNITSYAPLVSIGNAVITEIPKHDINLTGYAPTVSVSNNIEVIIPTHNLSLASYPPSLVISSSVSAVIPKTDINLTSYAPLINTGATTTIHPGRIYTVEAENRVYSVESENRVYTRT